jgi:hypothetical protein
MKEDVSTELLSSQLYVSRISLIPNYLHPVTQITPARENYHCPFPIEADNEERNYVYAVPTEVGL